MAEGRTLWQMLKDRKKGPPKALELQFRNPLAAKVGQHVSFTDNPTFEGIDFRIDSIAVYDTKVGPNKFWHTDYNLRGLSIHESRPVRVKLRLIEDEDEVNELGCKVQVLYLYDQMEWDEEFHDAVLGSESGQFWVNVDDDGQPLDEPRTYWRVDDVLDAYRAEVTTLKDEDKDGTVEQEELKHDGMTYWDYWREIESESGRKHLEYLTVEMDDRTRYFTFFRGREVGSHQIFVL